MTLHAGPASGLDFLRGGGEMGAFMRTHDWSGSPLGEPSTWPQSLRLVVSLLLLSKFPMFIAWGPQLAFLYNDPYQDVLGEKHPQALGRPFHDIWAEIWPDISPLIDTAMAGEASYRENLPLLMNRKGFDEQTWFTFSYSPVRDESGEVAGLFCVCTETTGQVLAERAVRESESRFRNMADHAPVMMWVTDSDGHCTYLNRAWYDFTGQTHREAEGFGWLDATHQEDKDEAERVFRQANAAQAPFRHEYRLRRQDGQYRWALDAASPRFSETGDYLGYVGSVIDIDERREAEQRQHDNEERLRTLTNALPAFVWLTAQDGEVHYFNDRWYKYTGQTPEEALPNGWRSALHPDDALYTVGVWADARAQGVTYSVEVRYRRHDGEYFWYAARAEPLRNKDDKVIGWVGTSTEIHDRKLAEDRLRASEARLRFTAELDERLRETTDAFAAMQAATDLLGRHLNASRCAYADFDADGDRFTIRSDYTASGVKSAVGNDSLSLFGAQSSADMRAGRTLVLRDVAVELPVDEGGTMFQAIGIHAIICCPLVKDGRLAAMMAVHQNSPRDWDDEEISLVEAVVERCWAYIERVSAQARLRELNETLERRVETALEERKLLADLVEGTDALVQVIGKDFNWLSINKASSDACLRIYGRRPVIGDPIVNVFDGDGERQEKWRATWQRALAGEQFTEIHEVEGLNQQPCYYETNFSPLRDVNGVITGAYQFAYDVTDRVMEQERLRVAEEALRQSQKMEAIGQLTGGVAHDFNNLLTPIIGGLDVLQRRGLGDAREKRLIAGAMQSAERARILVQRLLAFARRQPLQAVPVDIVQLMTDMGELVASTTGPQIKVVIDVAADLPPAQADPNQLEMAILNLSVNARDAMPDGGTLRISAAAEHIGEPPGMPLQPGPYIRLSVADTGNGMDEATLARAIEPFFSTKGIGKGTGLGLSMVHGLASQLGGAMTISSQPGAGTTIRMWVPQSTRAPDIARLPSEFPRRLSRIATCCWSTTSLWYGPARPRCWAN